MGGSTGLPPVLGAGVGLIVDVLSGANDKRLEHLELTLVDPAANALAYLKSLLEASSVPHGPEPCCSAQIREWLRTVQLVHAFGEAYVAHLVQNEDYHASVDFIIDDAWRRNHSHNGACCGRARGRFKRSSPQTMQKTPIVRISIDPLQSVAVCSVPGGATSSIVAGPTYTVAC